jgi:hypothetical protein
MIISSVHLLKSRNRIYQLVIFLLLSSVAASAQDLSSFATTFSKVKEVFAKIIPEIPDFSAGAIIRTYGTNGTLQSKMPLKMALSGNRMREEIDMMDMALPPQVRDLIGRAHLNKMAIITQIDAKKVFIVFPDVGAYQEFPIPESTLAEMTTEAKSVTITRKEEGQKMIGNHLCKKVKVLANEPNHPPEAALLECAIDLQDFPLQIDTFSRGTITQFAFADVQIGKPDASLFEVPANYTEFPNTAAILHYAKEKLLNSSERTPQ